MARDPHDHENGLKDCRHLQRHRQQQRIWDRLFGDVITSRLPSADPGRHKGEQCRRDQIQQHIGQQRWIQHRRCEHHARIQHRIRRHRAESKRAAGSLIGTTGSGKCKRDVGGRGETTDQSRDQIASTRSRRTARDVAEEAEPREEQHECPEFAWTNAAHRPVRPFGQQRQDHQRHYPESSRTAKGHVVNPPDERVETRLFDQ